MNKLTLLRFALMLCLSAAFHHACFGQTATQEKILGCWKVKTFEFLEPQEDSLSIINGAKGMIVCFENGGKFLTKLKTEKGEQMVGTGTYAIAADGKTISQKRDFVDEHYDEPGEIIRLSEKNLSLKAEGVILHFERVESR